MSNCMHSITITHATSKSGKVFKQNRIYLLLLLLVFIVCRACDNDTYAQQVTIWCFLLHVSVLTQPLTSYSIKSFSINGISLIVSAYGSLFVLLATLLSTVLYLVYWNSLSLCPNDRTQICFHTQTHKHRDSHIRIVWSNIERLSQQQEFRSYRFC